MKGIIEAILNQKCIAPIIREAMMEDSNTIKERGFMGPDTMYKRWELLSDPVYAILAWQEMLDRHPKFFVAKETFDPGSTRSLVPGSVRMMPSKPEPEETLIQLPKDEQQKRAVLIVIEDHIGLILPLEKKDGFEYARVVRYKR